MRQMWQMWQMSPRLMSVILVSKISMIYKLHRSCLLSRWRTHVSWTGVKGSADVIKSCGQQRCKKKVVVIWLTICVREASSIRVYLETDYKDESWEKASSAYGSSASEKFRQKIDWREESKNCRVRNPERPPATLQLGPCMCQIHFAPEKLVQTFMFSRFHAYSTSWSLWSQKFSSQNHQCQCQGF